MTRLITAAPALVTAAAACLIAAATAVHRVRRRRGAQPAGTGPRAVVEAALWDWWITTDPLQPFAPADVAVRIDEYLHGSGFTIAPDLRKTRMPTRAAIAGTTLIALVVTASTIAAACRSEWWWTAIGALAAALLVREICRDLAARHHHTNAR